jgi:formate hydrogenlyase subunit 6/NADH:ubiquinone oxidoreductase subunit I
MLAEKQRIQIGTATFLRDRCVVITEGTACGACAEVCPTHAVHMVPFRDHLTLPETDPPICIGCGNCEYSCPVEGGKAIYVAGKPEHTTIEERRPVEETDNGDGAGEDTEFPF